MLQAFFFLQGGLRPPIPPNSRARVFRGCGRKVLARGVGKSDFSAESEGGQSASQKKS
jgi:hypothetical protein